jgi:hypothetical protein
MTPRPGGPLTLGVAYSSTIKRMISRMTTIVPTPMYTG